MSIRGRATLGHFERLFTKSADPWRTCTSRDEGHKRKVILQMLGPRSHGRVLELGCGSGSNSRVLANRALSLDACDGSAAALRRAAQTVEGLSNVWLYHVPLPGLFPKRRYDAIVIAELLYYLDDRTLVSVIREIARTLRRGGVLILCHHHWQFADAAQRQADLHRRFIASSQVHWRIKQRHRTSRWEAWSLRRVAKKGEDLR